MASDAAAADTVVVAAPEPINLARFCDLLQVRTRNKGRAVPPPAAKASLWPAPWSATASRTPGNSSSPHAREPSAYSRAHGPLAIYLYSRPRVFTPAQARAFAVRLLFTLACTRSRGRE